MAKATIHDKKIEDLKKELAQAREVVRKFRFGIAGAGTKNVKESAGARKSIARILTELRRRELAE